MRAQRIVPLVVVAAFTLLGTVTTRGQVPKSPKKVVLIELFASQGCDLCPDAEQLLGQLPDLGYGPDRVVPLVLHVDYFNDPWKDPFSDPQYSQRESEYSRIYHAAHSASKPDVLYFTPLIMVDGQYPMLGSGEQNQARLKEALGRALQEKPVVSLDLALKDAGGAPGRKSLAVSVHARSPKVSGREILIGVATFEDQVTTEVASGELGGKTYVGHNVVRKLAVRRARLRPDGAATLTFPVELAEGWRPERSGLAVFAQDEKTGRVFQAASIAWTDRADAKP